MPPLSLGGDIRGLGELYHQLCLEDPTSDVSTVPHVLVVISLGAYRSLSSVPPPELLQT